MSIGTHWADCWRQHTKCAHARIERLEEALLDIDSKWVESRQAADAYDDTGAHVGIARREHAVADGLAVAAEIARAALAEEPA